MTNADSPFYLKPCVDVMPMNAGPYTSITRLKYYLKDSDGKIGQFNFVMLPSLSAEDARALQYFLDAMNEFL